MVARPRSGLRAALTVLAFGLGAIAAAPAHAQTPVKFAPWLNVAGWDVKSSERACLAIFAFKVTSRQTVRVGFVEAADFTVFKFGTPGLAINLQRPILQIRKRGLLQERISTVPNPKDPDALDFFLGGEDVQNFEEADGFVISEQDGEQYASLSLQDANVPRMLPLLHRCAREALARDKGSGKPAVSAPVLTAAGDLVSFNDLGAALTPLAEGRRMAIRLTVSAKGRVSDCVVTTGSGVDLIDEKVCIAVSQRARFTPALDAEGPVTESRWTRTVHFEEP